MNTEELILILQSFPPDAVVQTIRPWFPVLNGMKSVDSVKSYKTGAGERVIHIT